ncbi:unnamed protein product [Amaranthus hypochondriacus]
MGSSFDDNGNSQPNEGTQFEESVDRTFDDDEDTRQPTKKQKNQRRATTSSRSNRSKWWDHYTVDELDPTIAHCKYCTASISCHSKNGTTSLANHTKRCKKYPPNLDLKQKKIEFDIARRVNEDGSVDTVGVPNLWEFDYDLCRKKLATMLIVDELPFAFVEREGFREYCRALNPLFKIPSRSTATRDCYSLFIEKRNELKSFFHNFKSRICLTTDTWTSGQNLSYMCLTSHFIDDNWNLQKKIINFCEPHDSNFEILAWWKDQTKRYPILQKMAKDVLAIPISTVASESAFSTGGRILDDFRTSLTPKMAEALICAQDWLRKSRTPLAIEESLLALEEMEEGNALTLEHPEVIIDETLDTVEDD